MRPRAALGSAVAVTLLVLSAGWPVARGAAPAPKCRLSSPPGYLHSSGAWLEDATGCKIRLAGATWDGAQSADFVPGGLNFRPYTSIIDSFVQMGFNTIRIPLSDQLVKYNGKITVTKDVAANPSLIGLHPLEVLDMIVAYAQHDGLMIILDNHFSMARHCPNSFPKARCPANGTSIGEGNPNTPPWTDSGYSQSDWIADWVTLAGRYASPHVCGTYLPAADSCGTAPVIVGFDLRNEPHTSYGGHAWTLKDYLTRGAVWGPYPSPPAKPDKLWNANRDWVSGAEAAGDAVLAVNPRLLIIVEGVQLYPDKRQRRGVEVYTWGGILRGARVDPVRFFVNGQPVLHQIVYSPHEWGPMKDNLLGEFSYRTTYATMMKVFTLNWAFLLNQPRPALNVPIWLGEFNTCNSGWRCITNKKHGSQGQWFQIMMRFLKQNPEVGWSYYVVNGTNWLNEAETNSLLNRTWTGYSYKPLIKALRQVENQPNSR